MADINAGYMGILNFGGSKLRFTDCSIAPKQEVNAPDLVMGDYNHDSWYYGAITIEGSASGPIDDSFGADIWDKAWTRDSCGNLTPVALDVVYFCGSGGGGGSSSMGIPDVLINSITISATAGDIANWSFDVMGAGAVTFGSESGGYTDSRKILTWDALSFTATTGPVTFDTSLISAFTLTLSNNVTPAYLLGAPEGLYPSKLVTGIRTISGSVTVYNIGGTPNGWPEAWDANVTTGSIAFSASGLSVDVPVLFHRVAPSGQVGPVTSTIAFTGVSYVA